MTKNIIKNPIRQFKEKNDKQDKRLINDIFFNTEFEEKYYWIHHRETDGCQPSHSLPITHSKNGWQLNKQQLAYNEMEELVLVLHNELREIVGRPPVRLNQNLCQQAGQFARTIAKSGYYEQLQIGDSTTIPHVNHDRSGVNILFKKSILLDDDRSFVSRVIDSQFVEYAMDRWRQSSWRQGTNFNRIIAYATTDIGVGCAYEDHHCVITVIYKSDVHNICC